VPLASTAMPRPTADRALAAVLRRLRTERGLSQEGLAHASGLTTAAYSRIEGALSSPGWSTVRRIAEALHVSMAELGAAVDREEA